MVTDSVLMQGSSADKRADPYVDETDRKKHRESICQISSQMHVPVPVVAACYEQTLRDFRRRARIHDFLDVFVAKRVHEQLRDER